MLGRLEVGDAMLRQHVTAKIPLGLEGTARWAPHRGLLPRLRNLAVGDMPQVRKDGALLAVGTHPRVLLHLPLAGEQTTTVGTVVLQIFTVNQTLSWQINNNALYTSSMFFKNTLM